METSMVLSAARRPANRPIIALVWFLTLLALIPFHTLPGLLFGGLLNLASNGLALFLALSPSLTDRFNGILRLSMQAAFLLIGGVLLFKSGASIEGLYHFVMNGAQ